jgi:hypothetical protein
MPYYLAKVVNDAVTLNYYQWQFHFLSQRLHCLQAMLVLHIGVDIGVIPQGADLIPLLSPVFDGIGGTVGTTAMN